MITAITKNNIYIFNHIIPENLLLELDERADYAAIGSIRLTPDGVKAMGALVYNIDRTEDGEKFIRIQWLYVIEEYRDQTVGTELMMELFWNALNIQSEFILCDIPANIENNRLTDFLTSFRFDFRPAELPVAEVPIAKIIASEQIQKLKGLSKKMKIIPLSDITKKEFRAFCNQVINNRKAKNEWYDPCLDTVKKSYFDENVSALFLNDNGIYDCGILVRKDAFGNYNIIVFDKIKSVSGMNVAALIEYAARRAMKNSSPENLIRMEFHTEKQILLARGIFETAAFPVVNRGQLLNEMDDMTPEEWEGYKDSAIQALGSVPN